MRIPARREAETLAMNAAQRRSKPLGVYGRTCVGQGRVFAFTSPFCAAYAGYADSNASIVADRYGLPWSRYRVVPSRQPR
jgi:hypothetical protein